MENGGTNARKKGLLNIIVGKEGRSNCWDFEGLVKTKKNLFVSTVRKSYEVPDRCDEIFFKASSLCHKLAKSVKTKLKSFCFQRLGKLM